MLNLLVLESILLGYHSGFQLLSFIIWLLLLYLITGFCLLVSLGPSLHLHFVSPLLIYPVRPSVNSVIFILSKGLEGQVFLMYIARKVSIIFSGTR